MKYLSTILPIFICFLGNFQSLKAQQFQARYVIIKKDKRKIATAKIHTIKNDSIYFSSETSLNYTKYESQNNGLVYVMPTQEVYIIYTNTGIIITPVDLDSEKKIKELLYSKKNGDQDLVVTTTTDKTVQTQNGNMNDIVSRLNTSKTLVAKFNKNGSIEIEDVVTLRGSWASGGSNTSIEDDLKSKARFRFVNTDGYKLPLDFENLPVPPPPARKSNKPTIPLLQIPSKKNKLLLGLDGLYGGSIGLDYDKTLVPTWGGALSFSKVKSNNDLIWNVRVGILFQQIDKNYTSSKLVGTYSSSEKAVILPIDLTYGKLAIINKGGFYAYPQAVFNYVMKSSINSANHPDGVNEQKLNFTTWGAGLNVGKKRNKSSKGLFSDIGLQYKYVAHKDFNSLAMPLHTVALKLNFYSIRLK